MFLRFIKPSWSWIARSQDQVLKVGPSTIVLKYYRIGFCSPEKPTYTFYRNCLFGGEDENENKLEQELKSLSLFTTASVI